MFSPKLRSILSRISLTKSARSGLSVGLKTFPCPGLIAGFAIALVVAIVQQSGGLQPLELRIFDGLVRLRPEQKPDPRLLVVAITEADLNNQGWPLSDEVLAETLAQLQKHQPRAIGIDVYRDLPQPPGTEKLAEQLQAENIIAITNLGVPPIPSPPNIPPERIGFNDVPVDPDGVIRRQLLFASTEEETLFSFSLQLALFYLKTKGVEPKNYSQNPNYMRLGDGVFVPLKAWSGGYAKIDDLGYQILLNYRGPRIAKKVSIGEVLSGNLNPSLVRDKIVLIGATAPSLKDVFLTPYSAGASNETMMPGVFVHAQMTSHLIGVALNDFGTNSSPNFWQSPRLFWFLPRWLEPIWILGWALIAGSTAWTIKHPAKQAIALSGGLLVLFGIGYILFVFQGWLPLVAPALAFVLTSVSVIAYKQVYYLSHDPLTGLPNRASFLNYLHRKVNTKKRQIFSGILFLNIDRFKVINDSLGHQAGDRLLIELVQRLRTCVRTSDMIARLSADEFAILIENLRRPQNAIRVAERIQQALILPFSLQGQEVFRTISIGIALNDSTDTNAEALLRNANTAMYQARSQGTGSYQVFEQKMDVDGKQYLQLETDLRRALERQEFVLHYQPLISLETGKIIGLEALIRWQHPKKDLLFPDEFMPIAKETGLIIPMGQWVIKEACHQLKILQDRLGTAPELIMGVNLSSRQFSQPDLVEQIREIILESAINPQNLRLEISESIVMKDVDETIDLLKQLKASNVRLSIDDFGTGFSSLSSLNRFPVDTLKIDRSFISQMEADEEGENLVVVQTIITLAHVLKLAVIAEGVETLKQVEQLRSLGCEFAQGYYFLKPVPVDVALAFIESDPRW